MGSGTTQSRNVQLDRSIGNERVGGQRLIGDVVPVHVEVQNVEPLGDGRLGVRLVDLQTKRAACWHFAFCGIRMKVNGVIAAHLREKRHRLIDACVLIDDRVTIRVDHSDDRVKVIGRRRRRSQFTNDIGIAGS